MNEERLREWPVMLVAHIYFQFFKAAATVTINRGKPLWDAGSADAAGYCNIPFERKVRPVSTLAELIDEQVISFNEESLMDQASARTIASACSALAVAVPNNDDPILPFSTPASALTAILACISDHFYSVKLIDTESEAAAEQGNYSQCTFGPTVKLTESIIVSHHRWRELSPLDIAAEFTGQETPQTVGQLRGSR